MKRLGHALFLLAIAAVPAYAGTATVTPEPATIGLVATGIGALGITAWIRRRRR
jgi:hypothetical protein